jgi:copper resistance protein C
VVTTSAGTSVARGPATVLGGKVTQPLSSGLASGAYRVAYRVTSDDGHPVTGQSGFTLTLASGPASSSPSGTPSVPATATPLPDSHHAHDKVPVVKKESWLKQYLVPISGTGGLLVIGGGVLLWERRRR